MLAIFLSQVITGADITVENNNYVITEYESKLGFRDYMQAPLLSLFGVDDGQSITLVKEGRRIGVASLVLLVYSIGLFVLVCTSTNLFERIINYITSRKISIELITLCLIIYLILSASTYGLYESAICYVPLIGKIYSDYNVSKMYYLKVVIISLAIGYIASPINPFATLIADQVAANSLNMVGFRTALLIGLSITFICLMIFDLRQELNSDMSIIDNDNTQVAIDNKLAISIMLFLCPYGYMIIGLMPNVGFKATLNQVALTFISFAIIMAVVNELEINEWKDTVITTLKTFSLVNLIIVIGRMIYVILYNAHTIDPLIYKIVQSLTGLSRLQIIIIIFFILFTLGLMISSPSALALVTLPLLTPALLHLGISASVTVSIFLLAHGLTKIISLTSPLVVYSLDYNQISLTNYIMSIIKYIIVIMIINAIFIFSLL